jgi:hypothetical protein
MKAHSLLLAGLLAQGLLTGAARASVIEHVDMTFASGARFSGNVTFSDDFKKVLDVDGALKGYRSNHSGYVGGDAVDPINWVWSKGHNYSTGANATQVFLMDGPGDGYVRLGAYANFIEFAYSYAKAPILSFTSKVGYKGLDNYIDYKDQMVSGRITPVSPSGAVPEPAAWSLMILGTGALGAAARRRNRAAPQSA